MESQLNKDGTRSFLVDGVNKVEAISVLSRFDIELVDTIDAIFDSSGRVLDVEFVVLGSEADISFALDSITKFIRPYPKGFIHKR
jgi:reverse gyrase